MCTLLKRTDFLIVSSEKSDFGKLLDNEEFEEISSYLRVIFAR